MNQELLQEQIDHWEEPALTLIKVIKHDHSVQRIFNRGSLYWVYRYFTLGNTTTGEGERVVCSVDVECEGAESIIKHLAEQL